MEVATMCWDFQDRLWRPTESRMFPVVDKLRDCGNSWQHMATVLKVLRSGLPTTVFYLSSNVGPARQTCLFKTQEVDNSHQKQQLRSVVK